MAFIPKPRWTRAQVNLLATQYTTLTDEEVADILGKTVKAIRRKRARLELKKASGRGIVAKYQKPNPLDQSIS